MRGGILLLLAGILLAYLGVSGKYACFTVFAKCVSGSGTCGCDDTQNVATTLNSSLPIVASISSVKLPQVPAIPSLPKVVING